MVRPVSGPWTFILMIVYGCCTEDSAYIWRLGAVEVLFELELVKKTVVLIKTQRLIRRNGNSLIIIPCQTKVEGNDPFHPSVYPSAPLPLHIHLLTGDMDCLQTHCMKIDTDFCSVNYIKTKRERVMYFFRRLPKSVKHGK